MKRKKLEKGFTLVEMLVVIVIISLLATVAIVALGTARARARDSKRVADIRQLQTALETYFAEKASYPITTGIDSITLGTDSTDTLCAGPTKSGFVGSVDDCGPGATVFMLSVPKAPEPKDGGCTDANNPYKYKSGGADYELTFCLGSDTGGLSKGPKTATPAGIR